MDSYACDKHGTTTRAGESCHDCAAAFANRRDPGAERAAELVWWGTILTIPFEDLHQRYEELVGRPIWTHEFADSASLIEEARTRAHPTPQEILNKIPSHVPVSVVVIEQTGPL